MTPEHVNPMLWHQSVGYARQSCANIFRDGGSPQDALNAFGVKHDKTVEDWSRAVEMIAETLAAAPQAEAA